MGSSTSILEAYSKKNFSCSLCSILQGPNLTDFSTLSISLWPIWSIKKSDVQDGLVHIRIQQRNGRKTLTTIQGLSSDYDLKKIVRACKKEFACNGTVIEHPEYGEVLQLQGDQRTKICGWLTKSGLVRSDQLKVHGF